MPIFLIIGLIVAAGAVVFALQNAAAVSVSFFVWQWSGSLSLVLIAALICGAIVITFLLLPGLIRVQLRMSALKKRLKKLESELAIDELPKTPKHTGPTPVDDPEVINLDEEQS